MTRLGEFLRRNKYFLLAHHPKCEVFSQDTMGFRGIRLCIGCFVTIPVFILVLSIGIGFSLFQQLIPKTLIIIGTVLCFGYLIGKVKSQNQRRLKILSKFLVGIGGAFLTSILWQLPFSNAGRIVMVFVIVQFAFMGHGILRTVGIYRTCKRCEHHLQWRTCPGMQEISTNLEQGF